jgi:CheY-like chemotaxis protein
MPNRKVLIIDDNADTRMILSAQLRVQQYDSVFAADAMQAIMMARQAQPDAILLDLGMPGGNGFVVLQRLKSNTSLFSVPVIIVSAEEPKVAEAKCLAAGAAAFLHKPVPQDKLLATLAAALGDPLKATGT